jgi:zinc protease
MDVLVVERRDLPKVDVRLTVRAGSAFDPAGKEGLAALTLATVDKGTRTRKALQIEDALGDLGTSLSAEPGRESSSLTLEVLRRNLAPALEVLADVARNPTFPASEVERERARQLDGLAQLARNPNAVAFRVAAMLNFGAAHPYGRPPQGLPASVGKLGPADAAAFHAARYRPGAAALVLVGGVNLEEAKALAEKAFGGWTGGAPAPLEVPPAAPSPGGRIYLVDRQDAPQSTIAVALRAPPRSGDDFYALAAADAVYGGGGFGTRLNLNLRENKGYSYGVFSILAPLSRASGWLAAGGVQTDKTKESLVEFRKELADLAGARPVTSEELEMARTRKLRGYAQQFESFGRVSGQVAVLWTQGLPFTELQREPDAVAAVTLDAVRAAASRHAKASDALVVVVGDRSRVEGPLASLGLEIVPLDPEGKPAGAPVAARPAAPAPAAAAPASKK